MPIHASFTPPAVPPQAARRSARKCSTSRADLQGKRFAAIAQTLSHDDIQLLADAVGCLVGDVTPQKRRSTITKLRRRGIEDTLLARFAKPTRSLVGRAS